VWRELEPHLRLQLAQAQSNKAPRGRKSDLADVKRLVRRFVAGELMLSFIPEPQQRSWRMVTRGRLQLIRERVQLQNQMESLLEEGRIKLSSVVSDLLGASGRRILRAWPEGKPMRRCWPRWATGISNADTRRWPTRSPEPWKTSTVNCSASIWTALS